MDQYSYEDIIINPNSKQAQACVGKEVYYASNPNEVLIRANNNNIFALDKLLKIYPKNRYPFIVNNAFMSDCSCIIPKKVKQKLEYVPFESADEFLNAYENSKYNVINVTRENKLISCGGIWLKSKSEAIWITQCINISDHGVTLGLARKFRVWKELFDGYRFLDGTPCGKKKE